MGAVVWGYKCFHVLPSRAENQRGYAKAKRVEKLPLGVVMIRVGGVEESLGSRLRHRSRAITLTDNHGI
jgi:hypothetical protein